MQIDFEKYHPLSEEMVDILCTKTQNFDKAFFRIEVAYCLAKLASNMHTKVRTATNSILPVNLFALAFADSGYGKNYSKNIIDDEMTSTFEETFTEVIYPEYAKQSIKDKAHAEAKRTGMDEIEIEAGLIRDFKDMGPFSYSFPEGSSAALKQLTTAISFSGIGAASLEMDEIGHNISDNKGLMSTLLELYDVGKTKDKLLKVTKEYKRVKSYKGVTPANVFAFGTPATAFDGGSTEDTIKALLISGYARRSFFAYGDITLKDAMDSDSEDVYAQLTDPKLMEGIQNINQKLGQLASLDLVGQEIYIDEAAERYRLKYNQHCSDRAKNISDFRLTEKYEMSHRAIKVTKLAGAYAFIDGATDMTIHHLEYAIAIAETSGDSLQRTLKQPKAHVKLANFLCDFGSSVTESDLVDHLPFYSGNVSKKRDLMTLATAYGHRNAMAIKSFDESGVTMYQGEKLEETIEDKIIISHSTQMADGYTNSYGSLAKIVELLKKEDTNFCNHHFKNGQIGKGNRSKATTLEGANMVWFDIDESKWGARLIHKLMAEYNHIIYETKSSTKEAPRFRLGIVLSHTVKLDDSKYKHFSKNVAAWLPVTADSLALQRERKYRVYADKNIYYVDNGRNLDVMAYYPNTKKAEENTKFNKDLIEARIQGMEKWVIHTAAVGSRNSTLFAYAKFLLEHSKKTEEDIITCVKQLNAKLREPLDEIEIEETIIKSIRRK